MAEKEVYLIPLKRYAELHEVTRKTAREWVKKGLINTYRVPGRKRYLLAPHEVPKR